MIKKIALIFVSLVFLLIRPAPANALGLGAACTRNEDCDSGLICQTEQGTSNKKCLLPFGTVEQPYGSADSGYGPEGFVSFLNNVVAAVMTGAGLLLFVYLILGGIKYMTAGGDEKAVTAAKRILTNAIVGLIIIAGAYFIATILEKVLGISILTPVFKGP